MKRFVGRLRRHLGAQAQDTATTTLCVPLIVTDGDTIVCNDERVVSTHYRVLQFIGDRGRLRD